jgi:heme oxygenase
MGPESAFPPESKSADPPDFIAHLDIGNHIGYIIGNTTRKYSMSTETKQANFLLPEDLLEELKRTVSKGQQSKIVANALRKELKRLKLEKVLDESFGAWNVKDHPELKGGTDAYVRRLRKSSRLRRNR